MKIQKGVPEGGSTTRWPFFSLMVVVKENWNSVAGINFRCPLLNFFSGVYLGSGIFEKDRGFVWFRISLNIYLISIDVRIPIWYKILKVKVKEPTPYLREEPVDDQHAWFPTNNAFRFARCLRCGKKRSEALEGEKCLGR